MRAKMVVTSVDDQYKGQEDLTFSAVCKNEYDQEGSDENNTYARWTPSAQLSMSIMNPNLHGKFKVGDEFYLDFTKVEK